VNRCSTTDAGTSAGYQHNFSFQSRHFIFSWKWKSWMCLTLMIPSDFCSTDFLVITWCENCRSFENVTLVLSSEDTPTSNTCFSIAGNGATPPALFLVLQTSFVFDEISTNFWSTIFSLVSASNRWSC
jgi:hypothetical protein